MESMFSTLATALSIFSVTRLSSSSGPASVYVVIIIAIGISTSGVSAICIFDMETTPRITITSIAINMATGRLMEIFVKSIYLSQPFDFYKNSIKTLFFRPVFRLSPFYYFYLIYRFCHFSYCCRLLIYLHLPPFRLLCLSVRQSYYRQQFYLSLH